MVFLSGNSGQVIKDPVSGFEYPHDWITGCPTPELLPLVSRGLAILTSDGTVLMRGYTTGTTAAAACKAAVLSLQSPVASVTITTPSGIVVEIPVNVTGMGSAECRKYAGDYPDDVTAGILFRAVTEKAVQGSRSTPARGSGGFPTIHPATRVVSRL